MTSRPIFFLGVFIGIAALVTLFVFPAGPVWLPLFVVSGALTGPRTSRSESTSDASNVALRIAFFGVALLFAFLLIPDSFRINVPFRIPEWAYGRDAQGREAVPLWAGVGITVIWSVLTFRRFQQLGALDSRHHARS